MLIGIMGKTGSGKSTITRLLNKENKFKEAVRFLHYLSTNHSEKVPNKKVAHYAREQIIF